MIVRPHHGDHIRFLDLSGGEREGVVHHHLDQIGKGAPGFIVNTDDGPRWGYDSQIIEINGQEVAS